MVQIKHFFSSFELNTSIEYPHEISVNSILFQPLNNDDNLRCVTVGDDKKFRVWQLMDFESVYSKFIKTKINRD